MFTDNISVATFNAYFGIKPRMIVASHLLVLLYVSSSFVQNESLSNSLASSVTAYADINVKSL